MTADVLVAELALLVLLFAVLMGPLFGGPS